MHARIWRNLPLSLAQTGMDNRRRVLLFLGRTSERPDTRPFGAATRLQRGAVSVPKTAADRVPEGSRAFSEGRRINRPEPILAGPVLIGIPIMSRDELLNA
jgi:hypothetical protein